MLPLFLVGTVTDDQGLGLGFADALVSRLGNLQGVDILPTSSVLDVPTEATASDIASRLGVRSLVHGAIRESKGELRVSLEMFDTHLQSPCFTRKCDLDVNRLSYLERRDRQANRWRIEQAVASTGGPASPPAQQGPASLCGIHARLQA